MKLKILGTGNAQATACYNTCFVLEGEKGLFLIDGGGGNTVLQQLKKVDVNICDVKDIFVTHKHIDHLLGIIWIIRIIGQNMNKGLFEGEARIYAHQEVIDLLTDLSTKLIDKKQAKHIGDRIHLITVEDGECKNIIGNEVTFFDIGSTKAKQFGFTMQMPDGDKLTCCGDEPYSPVEEKYVAGSKWLLHEAFCLYSQADIFEPYEKHHSTVKEACELAESMNIPNLVLYHTEDKNIGNRKAIYTEEGKQYYNGNLYIPDDLDVIEL